MPNLISNVTCAAALKAACPATGQPAPFQKFPALFGLKPGPSGALEQLTEDLAFFLLARGPYAWLGWGTWGMVRALFSAP